jgi:capsular polysaccharide transport system ATP-binding protein
MILLEHITKSYGQGRKAKDVLLDVNLALDGDSLNIGILGAKGSGKTTLLHIMAGTTLPDRGRVTRQCRVSWPLTWRGLGGNTTGDEQVGLLARMYQVDRRALLRYVAEVSELDAKLYEPMTSYSAREKDRLMQAAALALDFEVYLVDEAIPGVEKEFSARYEALWQEVLARSFVVAASSRCSGALAQCPAVGILVQGRLMTPVPPQRAEVAFHSLMQNSNHDR